jgi:calcineurin-like phosphoesterase family protein
MDWFISDPHFSHKNIQRFEPSRQQWKDVNEMDEGLIKNFNDTVEEGDTPDKNIS